ncbi:hypothetical protein EIN_083320 [Entamoeba invadens IP1]|uniref:hypothetical protein n=1 Tax=Entamoeba invadens IP1 TaxID=370355 RepID=UPI0002C3F3D1|nr:hypothetical protein EIN_083320 [Entamoeba invadens IP1]ELP85210.1 hypothetical protein EIN_083320 [Entamoeba invadens IP1]|eukprot:XP_004184556.1 hypothetical protein EIN_083320 [Entamoeba invadens IP1]
MTVPYSQFENKGYVYNICVVGDANVGKTSIVRRLVKYDFTPDNTPFSKPVVEHNMKVNGKDVRLRFHDPKSDEMNGGGSFYTNCEMLIYVFNYTELNTLEHCLKWDQYCTHCVSKRCKKILVGTHVDVTHTLTTDICEQHAHKLGCSLYSIDCKGGMGALEIWEYICSDIQTKFIPMKEAENSILVNLV